MNGTMRGPETPNRAAGASSCIGAPDFRLQGPGISTGAPKCKDACKVDAPILRGP